MNRRKILGGMIAAPFAGKKIAETAATGLDFSGIGSLVGDASPSPFMSMSLRTGGLLSAETAADQSPSQHWKLFRKIGVPSWVKEEWSQSYPPFPHIDDDVRELKSVSEAGRRAIQRERDWRRYEATLTRSLWDELMEKKRAWYDRFWIED